MENEGEVKTEEEKAESFPQTQQLCRFFSQGRHCHFGKRCRFLHVREDEKDHEKKSFESPSQPDFTPSNSQDGGQLEGDNSALAHNPKFVPGSAHRPCRYFLSGHCTMEDRCRFWHPPQLPPLDDPSVTAIRSKSTPRHPPEPHPGGLQEVKLCEMTEDTAKQLRDTEIRQLKKRFPKDQLIIQEKDGKLTYYRASVEATDPDWPFDLKEVDIMVSFPDNYPLEIFTLEIPLDQNLPSVMAKHVQEASLEWLQAKHATNQLLGKVELLFRPFLRWLDRSLERLFTEGARQLKKDIDLEKAGLQFITYQELQISVTETSDPASGVAGDEDARNSTEKTEDVDSEEEEHQKPIQSDEGQLLEEDASHLVENIRISDPRRGTEVKLLGLRLGENTATVTAQRITVCLQCN
uniref:Nucleoporin NUP42 n=1 Tax=Poecilia formosa TaxID=48698 RepID=A0A096MHK5_POEFO